jgi:hypothetical protein
MNIKGEHEMIIEAEISPLYGDKSLYQRKIIDDASDGDVIRISTKGGTFHVWYCSYSGKIKVYCIGEFNFCK